MKASACGWKKINMTENECCKNTDNRIESVHEYKKIKM